jgi:uncharacterized protein DUF742
MTEDQAWRDGAAGRLVRPYAIAGGRTTTTHAQLDLSTQVQATQLTYDPTDLEPEHEDVVALCRIPLAIAEVAAKMNIPLFVTKVLVGDLIDRGALETGRRILDNPPPDLRLLEQILDRLHAL